MLSLQQLRSFVVLAEQLHFGRAANRLAMTQPALSQQLKSLEQKVGAKLVERSSRQVALTPAGERLNSDAKALLAAAETAELNVRTARKGGLATLRLAFVGSGAFGILPELLKRYHARHRDVRIQYHDDHIHYPFELLEAGLVDVAVARAPVTHPRLTIETFYREPLCAVVPATHPLSRTRRIELRDMASEAFAFFPRRNAPEFHDAVIGACVSAGFSPRVEYEASDWQVLASIVAAGVAVSIAPASVKKMPRVGLAYRLLHRCRVRAELAVIYSERSLSGLVTGFLETARDL